MDIKDLKIKAARIHKLDSTGVTKAFVDISIADAFIVNGLRVIEGKDGLFVSMPKETDKDGKWYDVVIPLRRDVKDKVENVVLNAYEDMKG